MPLVRSITALADGFTIVTTANGTWTVSSADLTNPQKSMTTAQVETIINAFMAARLPANMFIAFHLTSVVPLVGGALISNKPITGSWWL